MFSSRISKRSSLPYGMLVCYLANISRVPVVDTDIATPPKVINSKLFSEMKIKRVGNNWFWNNVLVADGTRNFNPYANYNPYARQQSQSSEPPAPKQKREKPWGKTEKMSVLKKNS